MRTISVLAIGTCFDKSWNTKYSSFCFEFCKRCECKVSFCGYLTLLKIGCFFTLTRMVELESHFEDGSPENWTLKKRNHKMQHEK